MSTRTRLGTSSFPTQRLTIHIFTGSCANEQSDPGGAPQNRSRPSTREHTRITPNTPRINLSNCECQNAASCHDSTPIVDTTTCVLHAIHESLKKRTKTPVVSPDQSATARRMDEVSLRSPLAWPYEPNNVFRSAAKIKCPGNSTGQHANRAWGGT